MAGEPKADLKDGFSRISLTLQWAWAASGMGALEWAILTIVVADTWGRPERQPGYVSHLTGPDVVSLLELHGLCCNSGGRKAVKTLLKRQVLELHGRKLKINAHFPGTLNEQQLALFDDLRALHASRNKTATGVAPAPQIATPVASGTPTAATGVAKNATPVAKNATPVAAAYNKDARARDLELELTSSSNHSGLDKQSDATADDDEVSQGSETPAPAALELLTAQLLETVRRIDSREPREHLESINAITGLSDEELELGVARVLVAIIGGKMTRVKSSLGAAVAYAAKAPAGQFEDVNPQQLLAKISAAKARKAAPPAADFERQFAEDKKQRDEERQREMLRAENFKKARKGLLERIAGITGEEFAQIERQFLEAFGRRTPYENALLAAAIYKGLMDSTLVIQGSGILRLAQAALKIPMPSIAEFEALMKIENSENRS